MKIGKLSVSEGGINYEMTGIYNRYSKHEFQHKMKYTSVIDSNIFMVMMEGMQEGRKKGKKRERDVIQVLHHLQR